MLTPVTCRRRLGLPFPLHGPVPHQKAHRGFPQQSRLGDRSLVRGYGRVEPDKEIVDVLRVTGFTKHSSTKFCSP